MRVVLLVEEAHACPLHAQRVEHHTRPLALEHDTEHPRRTAFGHDFDLVLAVRYLDGCVSDPFFWRFGADVAQRCAVEVDGEAARVRIFEVAERELRYRATKAAFFGAAETASRPRRRLKRHAAESV